jgi:multidrug efflux pump subunit AcrA (membrane-fusion protein)
MTDPVKDNPPAEGGARGTRSLAAKAWSFVRIMNVRLRFILLMVIIGVVAGNWESIVNHIDRWRRPARAADMVQGKDIEYFCPMHPKVVRNDPANCPICGMPLSKRAKVDKEALPAGVLGEVQLTPLKMIMGRIGTAAVDYQLLAREFRVLGVVDYDETRQATITARVKGRLDKLLVNYTGQKVQQGDPLALIYSPDLLVAQQELLTAAKAVAGEGPSAATNQILLDSARKKLLLWGLTEAQVQEIIRRGSPETHVTITSPIAGIVTEKKALEGKYVMEGDELYKVADLSTVWLQAKIFEADIAGIAPGAAVEVTNTAFPGEIFAGWITFVAYAVDPATRTVAARAEIANTQDKLRPGMFATATIRLPVGKVTELASLPAPATRATTAPAGGPGVSTDKLAQAYLALAAAYTQAKTDPAAVADLVAQADALAGRAPQAADLAAKARGLQGKNLAAQRELFKAVSGAAIKLLQQHPPVPELFIAHCPMVNADWIAPSREIRNPYDTSMLSCGNITGALKPAGVQEQGRYAEGYYCPVRPDRLFATPEQCPLDKFPLKPARIEKVLAVPEAAIIDTGSRKVVYRQTAPGVFELIEVQVGPRAGDWYPVLSGLKEGDQVAAQGAFLVDAENRLNPAAGAQYFGAGGGPGTAAPAGEGGGHKH